MVKITEIARGVFRSQLPSNGEWVISSQLLTTPAHAGSRVKEGVQRLDGGGRWQPGQSEETRDTRGIYPRVA
jgi:hypothetical protein